MLTLLAAALPALAVPSTGDYTCSDFSVPYGADEACRCTFESENSDWTQPGEGTSTDPVGTCFEMTANVNSVVATKRDTWYHRVALAGFVQACTTGRWLNHKTTYYGDTPWVDSQVITSMEDGESCGVGVGMPGLREIWAHEESGGWAILDPDNETIIGIVVPRKDEVQPVRVWLLDDDNDEELDVVIYWEDAVIWTSPVPRDPDDYIEAPTNTPDDEDVEMVLKQSGIEDTEFNEDEDEDEERR